jgi:tRNA pseudouridine38-40 synthase
VRTLKLVLAYEGTPFVGWQRQAEGVSVQSVLEEALARIEGRAVAVTGAGRTDAGVHALGQVASCALDHPIPPADLRRALNAMLPPEVRVTAAEEAPDAFHARYSARGKSYRYAILCADTASPFLRRYAWHVSQPLDVPAMAAAARLLEGVHDFAAFQSAGSSAKTTRRTIFSSRVVEARPPDGPAGGDADSGVGRIFDARDPAARLVFYEVSGDGFLRHMVRAIVGTLVEVGAGRQAPAWIGELLQPGSRDAAGPTAPAHGLWLVKVEY